jgi:hypothetical protein
VPEFEWQFDFPKGFSEIWKLAAYHRLLSSDRDHIWRKLFCAKREWWEVEENEPATEGWVTLHF